MYYMRFSTKKEFIDLTGSKFARLKLIEFLGQDPKTYSYLYRCICDCGKEKITSEYKLKKSYIKSCGCLSKELFEIHRKLPKVSKKKQKPTIDVFIKEMLGKIKAKNLPYDLNIEDIKRLCFDNCFYCNSAPSNHFKKRNHEILYNGIDRMNSDLGYLQSNTVACCSNCNYMKSDHALDSFLNHIEKIWNHRGKKT